VTDLRPIRAEARHIGAPRVAPGSDARVADPSEGVAFEHRVARVGGEEEGVAVQALEAAVLYEQALGALREDRSMLSERPISAAGHAVGVHVGVGRVTEAQAANCDVPRWTLLRSGEIHKLLRHHRLQRSLRWRCAV